MLLASGVSTGYEIVPIILDPDSSAADVAKTEQLLNEYRNINKSVAPSSEKMFFKNKMESLGEVIGAVGANALGSEFRLGIGGLNGGKFKDFIDYNLLEDGGSNQALIDVLFSESNLNLDLEVGFQGNPNIGSIVLNKFTESEEFNHFANSFNGNDRIFIISSIFGGTGAAGFPLILKNIRQGLVNGKNYDHLRNAVVGAITVMPYFKLDGDNTDNIQSSTFYSKTKAALHYYHKNISSSKDINALYYIADDNNNVYKNVVGGVGQKNDSHFVELAAALAIVDFANDDSLSTNGGYAQNPKYKEFGVNDLSASNPVITFKDLAQETQNQIQLNLTQLLFFSLYLENEINEKLKAPFAKESSPVIDQNFLSSIFYGKLVGFLDQYRIWLAEMKRNKISFSPYNIHEIIDNQGSVIGLKPQNDDLMQLVSGINQRSSMFKLFQEKSYDLMTSTLNESRKEKYATVENKLMTQFHDATAKVITKYLF
ncbi:hypothetical protein [Sphingobacterium ginsenosidimutans]